jgi:arabinose-5-phosphate isomerase
MTVDSTICHFGSSIFTMDNFRDTMLISEQTHSDHETAITVLRTEAKGLSLLEASLDSNFSRALDLIQAVQGRVVVTGIGKSGHIANKVAATLASTGTPSFFVHPSEASHGDLGMITDRDIVVIFSNSGSNLELNDIISYSRRHFIPLIGVTSHIDSPLGEQADLVLSLPKAAEACPMGLVPTTSTTMMLALGDALAIALLRRQGFSEDDYRVRHPGGPLGQRLVKVHEIMHSGDEIPLAPVYLPMREVILVMTAKRFGCVGIVDDKSYLVGIITDSDLRRHMTDDLMRQPARSIMTPKPRTIRSCALVDEALWRMNKASITTLFVTSDDERPIGIIHVHDCLRRAA